MLKLLIAGIGLVLSFPAAAQTLGTNGSLVVQHMAPSVMKVQMPRPGAVDGLTLTARSPAMNGFQTFGQLGAEKGFDPEWQKPGVYRTTPFACIVIVPGNHFDDPLVVRPSKDVAAMPMLKPELRFIPFGAK